MSDGRCALCGLPMHSFGFPADGVGRKPDAMGCANAIVERIEDMLEAYEPVPEVRDFKIEGIDSAVVLMAHVIRRLLDRAPTAWRSGDYTLRVVSRGGTVDRVTGLAGLPWTPTDTQEEG